MAAELTFDEMLRHSMRHWAQLAMALRERGVEQDWKHDFIFTETME